MSQLVGVIEVVKSHQGAVIVVFEVLKCTLSLRLLMFLDYQKLMLKDASVAVVGVHCISLFQRDRGGLYM